MASSYSLRNISFRFNEAAGEPDGLVPESRLRALGIPFSQVDNEVLLRVPDSMVQVASRCLRGLRCFEDGTPPDARDAPLRQTNVAPDALAWLRRYVATEAAVHAGDANLPAGSIPQTGPWTHEGPAHPICAYPPEYGAACAAVHDVHGALGVVHMQVPGEQARRSVAVPWAPWVAALDARDGSPWYLDGVSAQDAKAVDVWAQFLIERKGHPMPIRDAVTILDWADRWQLPVVRYTTARRALAACCGPETPVWDNADRARGLQRSGWTTAQVTVWAGRHHVDVVAEAKKAREDGLSVWGREEQIHSTDPWDRVQASTAPADPRLAVRLCGERQGTLVATWRGGRTDPPLAVGEEFLRWIGAEQLTFSPADEAGVVTVPVRDSVTGEILVEMLTDLIPGPKTRAYPASASLLAITRPFLREACMPPVSSVLSAAEQWTAAAGHASAPWGPKLTIEDFPVALLEDPAYADPEALEPLLARIGDRYAGPGHLAAAFTAWVRRVPPDERWRAYRALTLDPPQATNWTEFCREVVAALTEPWET